MNLNSFSARRWPTRVTRSERDLYVLAALRTLDGWADVSTIRRAAARLADDENRQFIAAPGTIRDVLRRLDESGLAEARSSGPATVMYRATSVVDDQC